jgi:hypothetical protein
VAADHLVRARVLQDTALEETSLAPDEACSKLHRSLAGSLGKKQRLALLPSSEGVWITGSASSLDREHPARGRPQHACPRRVGMNLKVTDKAPPVDQPSEGAFYVPPFREDLESRSSRIGRRRRHNLRRGCP